MGLTKSQLKREQQKLLEYSNDGGLLKRYRQTKMDKLLLTIVNCIIFIVKQRILCHTLHVYTI
jgi:hypothetical protein